MVFSSSIFLVYFLPLFLVVYFLASNQYKNAILLTGSLVFYAWGAPKFVFAILATTTIDFYLVKIMYNSRTLKARKLFLFFSLILNVGMLFYFKYCNFFIENFNNILSGMGTKKVAWTDVILPIGISFYTFESLTYVIDVYRKLHKPLNNFWQYQMYILLFPKLIAGPIIRYHEISTQIEDRSAEDTIDNKLMGFIRFCLGLGKKVLIANVLASKADAVFAMPIETISSNMAWVGALAYSFQIYFDFSGYSDMAIGIGKMLGFKFPENFNNPYTAQSVTDFWRRWHITLGNWMRNYLYIPLGGNQVNSKFKLYFNLWLVFIASGFWHGAAWTFIFWGIYHGCFLVLERMFLHKIYIIIGKIPSTFLTFIFITIGWVLFRANDLSQSKLFITKLFSFNFKPFSCGFINNEFKVIFLLAIVFSFFTIIPFGKKIQDLVYFSRQSIFLNSALIVIGLILYTLSLSSITSSGFNPFIYFRF